MIRSEFPDKRLIDMTASEFVEVMSEAFKQSGLVEANSADYQPQKRYVYGIAGIAQLFNCSKTTANRIKASGKIDKAIYQSGRTITVDAELAVKLLHNL